MQTLLWLIPLPPLIAFALISLFTRRSRGLSHGLALAAADPQLESLINLNKPDEYQAALTQPQPAIAVVLTAGHGADRQLTVRAATLGEALAQIGQTTDRACSITLNGVAVAFESELPLVPNDRLVLTAQ